MDQLTRLKQMSMENGLIGKGEQMNGCKTTIKGLIYILKEKLHYSGRRNSLNFLTDCVIL